MYIWVYTSHTFLQWRREVLHVSVVDLFEAVAFVLLVPHAFFWFNLMGLLAMELLAVGARVLLWLVVLVHLLFLAATTRLGALGFLALACAWLAFFVRQVAVGADAVRQFGVRRVGVLTHHRLEVGN
jgi:hypothetical protein